MTDTEQRETLAKWEGWTHIERDSMGWPYGNTGSNLRVRVPAYDLNDMGRVRDRMRMNSDPTMMRYIDELLRLTDAYSEQCGQPVYSLNRLIHATAAQHREAALKALGLWREGSPTK